MLFKPFLFSFGPFLVRAVGINAFDPLSNTALMLKHTPGKVSRLCPLSFMGYTPLPGHPFRRIIEAAYILVREPCPIRYALDFGAQRSRTSVKILAIHTPILRHK
jgi:hypothetical protein